MLDYVALALLILIVGLTVYGVIAVYGIPYEIAKRRNHPHREAIGAATWVSLFTLGALWPFLWIWALVYQPGRGWCGAPDANASAAELRNLELRIATLEHQHAPQVTD